LTSDLVQIEVEEYEEKEEENMMVTDSESENEDEDEDEYETEEEDEDEDEDEEQAEVVKALIAAPGCNLNVQDKERNTALHLAVRYGKSKVVTSLVSADCCLDVQDKEGKTVLDVAVANPRKRPVQRMEEVERIIRARKRNPWWVAERRKDHKTLGLQRDGKRTLDNTVEENKKEGGKGLAKVSDKSHDKVLHVWSCMVLRDNIQGITEPAIRRLAHRGGMKRISSLIYQPARVVLEQFLKNVILDAVIYNESIVKNGICCGGLITSMDVVYAIKHRGRTLSEIYSYHLTTLINESYHLTELFVRASGRRMPSSSLNCTCDQTGRVCWECKVHVLDLNRV
jgi:histone H4